MLKQLVMSSILAVTAVSTVVSPAFAGSTTFWGTSQVPNVACNIWGCPNAPLGAECTIHGCPPSPPLPVAPAPTPAVIVFPPHHSGSRNSGMGECMDRLMYRELQASSGPDRSGDYSFSKPQDVTADNMTAAGLINYRQYGWQAKRPVVKVQVMDGRTAAVSCR
jgi:hypothetical protein